MLDLLRGIIALAEERPMDVRLQRLAEEARGAGWQPIETAPRDGTRVDLWGVNHLTWDKRGGRKVNCAWGFVSDFSLGEREGWQGAGGEDFEPTHWMPLPEPPQLPEIPIYAMDAHKPEGE